jgi:hypothetical protein
MTVYGGYMKKAFVFAVLAIVVLGSCSNKKTVVGEWTDNEGITWIFSKDGKLTQDGEEAGTYAITATQLSFTQDGQNAVFDFSLSADGKTLLLNSSLYGSRALTKIYIKYSKLESGGGTFTLTDIPSTYDGKYAELEGYLVSSRHPRFYGENYGEKGDSPTVIRSRVSDGKLILPMWVLVYSTEYKNWEFKRYSGNDVVRVYIRIEVEMGRGNGVIFGDNDVPPVHFSKGSAIKSWNDGSPFTFRSQ